MGPFDAARSNRFASYELLGEIGSGGFGRVYKARHIHPNYSEKLFAIKTLRASKLHDHLAVERFRRECYAVAMLRHPNIVRTFEAGSEGDELFIAMEYVPGVDLATAIDVNFGDPIPEAIAVHICCQALAALQCGHNLHDIDGKHIPIIHRDIKPANILVAFDGSIKITDFGVAVIRGALPIPGDHGVLGTLGYLSPEVIQHEQPGPQADIFAIGAILFEMLCGKMAFSGETTTRLLKNTLKGKVPSLDKVAMNVPKGLAKVISKSLEPKVEKRFGRVEEMLEALAPFVPPKAGMPLLVSAWIRTLFPENFAECARLNLLRRRQTTLQSAAVCSDTPRRSHLISCLQELGYAVDSHRSSESLKNSIGRTNPAAIFVDLNSKNIPASEVTDIVLHSNKHIPIIALADHFDPYDARVADAAGAIDLIVPPIDRSRLELALMSSSNRLFHQVLYEADEERILLRVFVITHDSLLCDSLKSPLAEIGYVPVWCQTGEQAVSQMDKAIFHGVIYDVPAEGMTPTALTESLRTGAGIGLLPVLWMTPTGTHSEKLPTRAVVRKRDENLGAFCAHFNQLLRSHHLGRSFERYGTIFTARVSYRGQDRPVECCDIARGGLLMLSSKIIPVGSRVVLKLLLPCEDVEVQAQVVRVQMPDDPETDDRAKIGVAFGPTEANHESALIDFIAKVGQESQIQGEDAPPIISRNS
jgi:serine/threonine protein kinase